VLRYLIAGFVVGFILGSRAGKAPYDKLILMLLGFAPVEAAQASSEEGRG
jgi:hypothetical protein